MSSSHNNHLPSDDIKKGTMLKCLWLYYFWVLITLVVLSLPMQTNALPHAIRIGAIFTGKHIENNKQVI